MNQILKRQHPLRCKVPDTGHRIFSEKQSYYKIVYFVMIANFFLITASVSAQINATTPDATHSIAGYGAFQLPTATDMEIINGNVLQAIVATSPTPRLYWDNNAGSVNSLNIATFAGFPATATVYADDIALTMNPSNVIYAYVTCRVLLTNGTTEIYLVTFTWAINQFAFVSAVLQDTRPTGTDVFDAVKVDVVSTNNINIPNNGDIAIVWSNNGAITVRKATVNFANGSLGNVQTQTGYISGTKPDVCMAWENGVFDAGSNLVPGYYVSAINGNTVQVKQHPTVAPNTIYTSPAVLRTATIDDGLGVLVAVNELNAGQQQSLIRVFLNRMYNATTVNYASGVFNTTLEQNCTNNSNYLYTGFPVIKNYFTDWPHSITSFDVVWQQVLCNGGNLCNLKAIVKRANFDMTNQLTIQNNNQFIHLSNDLTRTSCFPSMAYRGSYDPILGYQRRICYSFDRMDANTSANGLVAYKTSAWNFSSNSSVLKSSASVTVQSGKMDDYIAYEESDQNNLNIAPNPATHIIHLKSKKAIVQVDIIDQNGITVTRKKIAQLLITTIDVSTLKNGQYIISVTYHNGITERKKIIKN